MHVSGVLECNPTWMTKQTEKCGTVNTLKSCKIFVTNGDVKLVDQNKIQRLLVRFSLGCSLTGA